MTWLAYDSQLASINERGILCVLLKTPFRIAVNLANISQLHIISCDSYQN